MVVPQVTPQGVPRDKWEYRTVSDVNWYELEGILNELGADGWEAVGFGYDPDGTSVLMKRRV